MTDPTLAEPAAPPTAPPAGPLADLLLVRLLPVAKKPPSPARLRADLISFFRRPPSTEDVIDALAGLRTAGLLVPKGQHLTDAGRARALAYLGVAELPPKANWGTVKAKYLVPKALGLSPAMPDDAKVLGKSEKLAALLLKRKLGLPVGTDLTLGAVFEAIACRQLGFPDHARLKDLIPTLLGRAIGGSEPIGEKDAQKVVPRVLLDARQGGANGLRAVALSGWADGESVADRLPESEPADAAEPFDLEAFAETVKSAARTCPTGRFGDNKVFISHVWQQLKDEPRFAPLGLAWFKQKLVEANRARLLTLSRADLVEVMDPTDVRDSEASYLGSVFHFVLIGQE
ncbi:MAG: hypothetical protein K2X87_29990 [Gemmataceae bacterium]|nr:hypothetical protein [Gemmataceae bacterium]